MKIARSVRIVEKDMLEEQFYKFTQRIESVTNHQSIDDLYKSDSKELKKIFSTSPSLYEGIEMIMQRTFVAAIKVSVEYIAETVISVYNRHNSDMRPLGEDQLNDVMFVAWNGPEVGEADTILKRALDLHFSGNRNGINFKMNNFFVTAGPTAEKY